MSNRGLRFQITASDRSKQAFNGVQNNLRKTQGLQRSWNAGLNSNRRAVQQFGFQMSDFAIQIAGGQSAMLAFTQQGGQMLQFFGPAGAIMAAFLAVFGSLAIAFTRSGKALSDLTPILGVLREDFAAIGRVLYVIKEAMIDFANVVINNMDRILITAGLLAGLMAGRWVVAFVAARVATFTLAGALTFLRGALIRTGIGALIVGAGELVYQFTRLVRGAGGFGNAMTLLGAVASEVWGRMGEAMALLGKRSQVIWQRMLGTFYQMIQRMMDQVAWFVNRFIGAFVGAYRAIVATFSALPDALKRFAGLAVNGLIDTIQGGLNAVSGAMNSILEALSLPTIPPLNLGQWKAEIGAVTDVAGKAKGAFDAAFGGTYIGNGVKGGALGTLGQTLSDSADVGEQWANKMSEKLGRPLKSLQDLKDAINSVDDAGKDIDIREWFKGGGGDDPAGGGGGGGRGRGGGGGKGGSISDKLSEEAKKVKAIFEDMSKTISSALGTAFKGLLDRTKSVKDVAVDLLTTILNKLTETMLNPVWDAIGNGLSQWLIGTPGKSGGFGGGILSGILNNVLSFAGGGYTGKGARSGGLDGRGGKLAMVHPNETISDHTRHQSVPGTGGGVEVHIHENASDNGTQVKQSPGRVDVFLRKAVSDVIDTGGLDKSMRRFGVKPQAMGT